jgi:hypothetical protein
MSSNPEVSSRILPDGTRETVYQNGVRCVQNGNVSSWYYPGQPKWHYRQVLNPETGITRIYTQEVDPNAVSVEVPVPG